MPAIQGIMQNGPKLTARPTICRICIVFQYSVQVGRTKQAQIPDLEAYSCYGTSISFIMGRNSEMMVKFTSKYHRCLSNRGLWDFIMEQ